MAVSVRRARRDLRPRAFDALIAAIAITQDLPLYTCNPRDFTGTDNLEVVAIPHPDSP